jgi:hypothetical protein
VTDFGIIPEGFRPKTLREVLDEIETDQHADISPQLDVSAQAPDGQRNAVTARQIAQLWELLQTANDGLDVDKAEDDQLITLCKITGTRPHEATFSEVTTTCNLDAGTTLTPGVHFAAVETKPDVLFTPKTEYTALVSGLQSVVFLAEVPGPVIANAGTLTVITTMIGGWHSITNANDAKPGQPADNNETLRTRREQELAAAGSGTAAAIRADLLQLEDANGTRVVAHCQVLNNRGDYTDADGVPGHSFEAIVYDTPTLPNDQIAQRIFDTAGAGIYAHGALSGTATDAETGDEWTIKFSRPITKDVYVTFEDMVTTAAYPGDAPFKEAVVTYLRSRVGVGDDVEELLCWVAAGSVPGVKAVGTVMLVFTASPAGTVDLPLTPRELAQFDTTRIVIA